MRNFINLFRLFVSQSTYLKKYLKFILFLIKRVVFFIQAKGTFASVDRDILKKVYGFTGYYNKTIINAKEDKLLFYRENKAECDILVLDLNDMHIRTLTKTDAWNFQQGAMAEFISNESFIFNRFKEGTLSAVIINVDSGEQKEIDNFPVQEVLPNKNAYISLNYNRLTALRPDYGYSKDSEWHKCLSILNDGLWLVTFNGCSELVVSLADLHDFENIPYDLPSKVNHVVASPLGESILFLFRYFKGASKISCLFNFNFKTGELCRLMEGVVSHYCWINENEYAVWYRDNRMGKLEIRGVNFLSEKTVSIPTGDGHPVLDPSGNLWFDSYPNLYNYIVVREIDVKTLNIKSRINVLSKPVSSPVSRCDAHPKVSKRFLILDSYSKDGRAFGIYKI